MSALETVVAACSATAALVGVGTLVVRGERRARRIVNGLLGDGGRHLGVLTMVRLHGDRLEAIEAQLHPNGGRSLRDVVTRIDDRTVQIQHRLDEHIGDRSAHI